MNMLGLTLLAIGAAFVLASGEAPSLAELTDFLGEQDVTKQFWPEHLVIVDEGTVHAFGHAGAGRQVKHVTVSEQRFGAHLVENRARIDLG